MVSRPSRTTAPRITAWSAPNRTSGWSVATRWLRQRREVADGLDQVGLALAVEPDQRGDPRRQRQLRARVAAEVGDGQVTDVHAGAFRVVLGSRTGARRTTGAGQLVAPAPDVGPASAASRAFCTAWPPNSPRSAATAFIVGDSSWREANRANSEAEMTGIGTELAIASSTVQRPSPESTV